MIRKRLLSMAIAAIVAGCARDAADAAKLDLPPGPGDRGAEPDSRALVDRVQRSGADGARRGGVRQQPRHRAIACAHQAARSQVLLAQSYLYPSVNLTATPTARAFPRTRRRPLPPGSQLASNNFGLSLQASYELDGMGQSTVRACSPRRTTCSLRATTSRRCASTIAGDVAGPYFRLRAADAELVVLQDTLKLRTDTVRLQRDRFEGGIIGEYDLRIAEAERSAVVADIARTQQAIGQLEPASPTLTGRSPRAVFTPEVARGASIEEVTEVPQLPAGLPSGPHRAPSDIRRNEALSRPPTCASRKRARTTSRRCRSPAPTASSRRRCRACSRRGRHLELRARLVQPLIGLKNIEAQVEVATARRDELTAQYAQTVQVAFREVHDALVANRASRDVLAAETDRRNQVRKGLRGRGPALRRRPHVVPRGDRRAAPAARARDAAHRRRARRQAVARSTSRSRWAAVEPEQFAAAR
jgi:outer membrane protein TolC